MKSLIGSIIAISTLFILILLTLGSQFGEFEITVWIAALTASLFFVVRHHRRNKNKERSGNAPV
ncbi:hypothetical protein ACIPPM_22570 [Streptomyces sp. NPDC090119]|uniref:hypothetical protein n=1 Tax=Streptomyces sp. NPDC090119 TaxID=3365951 RepID=UPI0037FF9E5A